MKRFVVCDGSEIIRYGAGPQRSLDAMAGTLPTEQTLHVLPDDFAGEVSDETHQWDEATQSVVPK